MNKSLGPSVMQGTVVDGQPREWPVKLCCYDGCSCCCGKADLPLCCYAAWCYPGCGPSFAAHLDVQACPTALCCNISRRRSDVLSNFAAVKQIGIVDITFQWLMRVGLGQWAFTASWVHVTPCLTMRTRHVFEEKKGLEGVRPRALAVSLAADGFLLTVSPNTGVLRRLLVPVLFGLPAGRLPQARREEGPRAAATTPAAPAQRPVT